MGVFTVSYYRTVNRKRLAILGLGLMGGSVAAAVRQRLKGYYITGYDLSPAARKRGLAGGLIDRAATSPAAAVEGADLVLLAAPVAASLALLGEIDKEIPPNAVVTDVCSAKRSLVEAAGRSTRLRGRFVGSHPMAGSANRGIEHADGTIFRKSLCILTPTPSTPSDTLAVAERFWRALGMKVLRLTPAEHDRRMALASHLPQVAASALMAVQRPETLAVAGKGLEDTTRLAGSDGGLWADILIDNAPAVTAAIGRLRRVLDDLKRAAAAGDRRAIERTFKAAQRNRSRLLGR